MESSDPGAVESVTQNPPAGTAVGLGITNVVFTVTCTNGSVDTCTALISVVDATPPVITGATNKSVEYSGAWTFDAPSATDTCGTNTLTVLSTTTNWTCGAAYVATRAWQAVDAFGNTATCTQVVTVVDTTPPVMLCPTNRTVECSSPWSFGTPVAADRGSGSVVVYDNSVNDLVTRFDTGTNEVGNEIVLAGEERYLQGFSYEFWSTNLTGSFSFEGTNVTVRLRFYANDGTNFNGYPTPGTLLYDSGEFWVGTGTTPRATVVYDEFDLWLYALHPLMDALPPSFTWTVQFSGLGTNDQAGVDLYSPPVIGQSYGDFWLRTAAGWQLRTNPAVAMDIAAQARASTNRVVISVLSTVTNAVSGGGYIATRIWQATDACGNFSTCFQTVTIVDTTPPVITGATNKSVEYSGAWTFDAPSATDTCGTNTLTVLSTTTNWTCGAAYVATRAWQAVDAFGNTATCTQVVTVVDTTPPVMLCPTNRTVECSSPWSFGTPVAADRGSGSVVVYDNSVNDLVTRFDTGTNEVGNEIVLAGEERYLQGFSYEFWSTNLTGSFSFEGTNVTVRLRFYANDGTNFNGYPTPGTLLYDSGEFWVGTGTTPRATVVYDEFDLWLYALHPLMDALPPSFTWTVQFSGLGTNDQAGVDLYSPPVIGQSYGDFWLRTAAGWQLRTNPAVAMDIAAQARASTNRVVISVLSTVTNALLGGGYIATRIWQATDACGNFSTCFQTVMVVDTTPPVITQCPTNRSLTAGNNCLVVLPDFTGELIAADACNPVSISQNPPPGAEVGLGQHVITFLATDTASNAVSCALLLSAVPNPGANTNLSISEFMAKNTSTIADNFGVFSDWIEIYNPGPCPVDMNGWSLTDDATRPKKWTFPATNIAAGQYLVVWASDGNWRLPGAPLHTNFKLSDGGEYLALVQSNGVTIATQFAPTFPPQLPDVSYGLPADSATNNYLAWPTPGAPNSPATNFVVADLSFTPGRGWFTNSVSVSMGTPTAGVTIYYTTNGTMPSPTNGFIYARPLVFSNTTVLRAAAYRAAYLPVVASHTYVFPNQMVYQTGAGFPTTWGTNAYGATVQAIYSCNSNIINDPQWSDQIPTALLSLPTVSVAMSTDDMFGTNGIYSNPLSEGDAWERPCSVEYFRPDSEPGFQIDCGIQIHGGVSRDPFWMPKHSLRVKFKQIYGAGKLAFDLYPGSPVREFDTLVLHGSFNDHWLYRGRRAQMQRDQWCADTQREMGEYGTHGTYVHLYLNGLYWGLYNLGERPDASYAAHYLGGDKSDYDSFKWDELKNGTADALNELLAMAAAGITNETSYSNVCHYLDVPDFIDYLLINFYAANWDWPVDNYWLNGSVTKGVPFRFFSWDAETTLLSVTDDLTGFYDETPGKLYSALRQYPEFRRLFGDHAQHLLLNGGVMSPERCAARWMQRAQEIDLAIIAESARWGATNTTDGSVITHADWLQEQNFLLTNWFPQRTDILIEQLRNAHLYPLLDAPVFTPHGGIIADSLNVTITAPPGTILYYTADGSDPRLPNGEVSPNALIYDSGPPLTLTLTNSLQLRARAFATNTWSALVEATYALRSEVEMRIGNITRRTDGTVKLDFLAWPGVSYTLRASTNLIRWEAIATLTPLPDGTFNFVDPAATNYSARFYALTWP